jgi:drug/metabolite transporter (DMT)-like permease
LAEFRRVWPYGFLIFSVMCWGGSFIATQVAMRGIPPFACAVLRFAMASVVMLALHRVLGQTLHLPRRAWRRVVWAAFTGVTMTYALENCALSLTTALNGSLYIAAMPLLTAAGAIYLLGERMMPRQWLGAILAATGLVMMSGANFAVTGIGDALMALTCVMGAIFGWLTKSLVDDGIPHLVCVTWTFLLGLSGLLPLAVVEALWHKEPWQTGYAEWSALAYLAILCSALCTWMWLRALSHVSVSVAGLFLYAMPVFTLIFSVPLLGDGISWWACVNGVIILFGVWLATDAANWQGNTLKEPASA